MHCFHREYAILRPAVIYDEKLGESGRGHSVSFSQSAAHVNDRRAVQRGHSQRSDPAFERLLCACFPPPVTLLMAG